MTTKEEFKKVKDMILEKYGQNKICFFTIDGIMCADIDEFIKQPADGILYDLNRDELTVLANLTEQKWVNDYACAKVIKKLKEKIEKLEIELNKTKGEQK